MYDLQVDCSICLSSFTLEHIRSLPCGHTYCSSCVEKLIYKAQDKAPTCPVCRHEFELDDVRRLFIKPSTSNNGSGSQTTPRCEIPGDQDSFIRQAKHIARRLQKINAKSSVQSVKTAADVIEHVATIQCKEAQEIIWKAVREFWLRLVGDFEKLDELQDLRDSVSSLKQSMKVIDEERSRLDETRSRLLLEAKEERSQARQYAERLEDKTREIQKLTVALRNVDDEAEQERERQRVLVSRLRASEMKYRVQVKQLKQELKSRKGEAITRPPPEEESLIIEPDEAYNEARSHRLDVYNESTPNSKRRKTSPEVSAPADGSNNPSSPGDLSDHWNSKCPPEMQIQHRERTGPTHQLPRPEPELVQPSPQRPKFGSDWNFSRQRQRRKLTGKSNSANLPFPLDAQGRPKGLLKYGSRVRMKAR